MIAYVSFGIVLDDIVLPGAMIMQGMLGGGGVQTAWGMAAALGGGESVGLCAVVGADCTPALLTPLVNAGIDLSGVQTTLDATPRAWQHFDEAGNRRHIWRVPPPSGTTVYEAALDALPAAYRGARGFHWGLHPENPPLEQAAAFAAGGAHISLETFRPPDAPLTPDALSALVGAATVFSPSVSEAAGLVGSDDHDRIIRAFADAGCRVLALRKGEIGAEVWDFRGGVQGFSVPALPPLKLIDPTGAGNAFCGAFLARLDDSMADAAAAGAAAASFMLEQFGIPHHLPARADFDERLVYARDRLRPLTL
jgi:sugar/nucleoside kinase (ribokinase family)